MIKPSVWLIGAAVFLSLATTAVAKGLPPEPFAATKAEDLYARLVPVQDKVFILSPGGLYRFTPEAETWNFTAAGAGLPPIPLFNLSITESNVWVTGAGVGFSDLRFDDWQLYRPGEGYPGTVVRDVEADLDYAYAGTDAGAARFDQYILEWETLTDPQGADIGPVADVAVGQDRVWFALENGVGEFRKEGESFRVLSTLDALESPRVLALRQSVGFLWAITDQGLARFDKKLRTWTSFLPGVDLPEARIHQVTLAGDDLWLGTDDGLWTYRAETGIWRQDDSYDQMPGRTIRSFRNTTGQLWVLTETAFAVYDKDTARWIDFTSSVPTTPDRVSKLDWINETLILLTPDRIVYGLGTSDNPARFLYRSHDVMSLPDNALDSSDTKWRVGLNEAGLGATAPGGQDIRFKGGATFYAQNEDPASGEPDGLGDLLTDTKIDLTMTGQLNNDRTLSGFYDSTDPENTDYQLTYRGNRDDVLRKVSVGEIDRKMYNTQLVPDAGLTGGHARVELGERSETTRRRLLTADAWVGEQRTVQARDVFYGGNRTVESSLRDVDYVPGAIFPLAAGWSADDLRHATYWVDDGTSDPNTVYGFKAGVEGAWNKLQPLTGYTLGPGGETLILSTPLKAGHSLVAERAGRDAEVDLTDTWLSNSYWLALNAIPGSMRVSIADTTGSYTDSGGTPYLQTFGLDADGDGYLDSERFSPLTGLLTFPAPFPFSSEAYDVPPVHGHRLEYVYQSERSTYRLSHRHVIPSTVEIRVDRELMRPGVDYDLIPNSGIFVFFEHVLMDEDSVIEVEYEYEASADNDDEDQPLVSSAQVGIAASDHVFTGVSGTRWSDDDDNSAVAANLNTRLEWKDGETFLRLTPEVAVSKSQPGAVAAGAGVSETTGQAAAMGLQGRYKTLEVSASHRSLGADYATFEDRNTLLGRLRERSRAHGLVELGRHFQVEADWDRTHSDQVGGSGLAATALTDSSGEGWGTVSSLFGSVRYLRSGWPNLELKRGRIVYDTAGYRQEKNIKRAELELSPDQETIGKLGIRRLWLRAFYERSEREFEETVGDTLDAGAQRKTDHLYVRLNGSLGSPLSWNLSLEDQHTFADGNGRQNDLRHFQKFDGTLQSQPHAAVDAFVRYVAHGKRYWYPNSDQGGFNNDRLAQGTLQLFPGRVWTTLTPLSFRIDLGHNQRDVGEPDLSYPGTDALFGQPDQFSGRQRTRNGNFETRWQIEPRVRLVLRYEAESGLNEREGLAADTESGRSEARLEITPRAGQIILRAIDLQSTSGSQTNDRTRLFGEWNQTWGGGFLTSFSIEGQHRELRNGHIGLDQDAWNPQAQVTWRRADGTLDASVGGSFMWDRSCDLAAVTAADNDWDTRRSIYMSLNLQPLSVMSIKVQYGLSRSKTAQGIDSLSGLHNDTDHDLRIRVHIRG